MLWIVLSAVALVIVLAVLLYIFEGTDHLKMSSIRLRPSMT
ncbi:hypothetical protein ACLRGI_15105 [Paenarthrobacter nitroguajacolicus]